MTAAQRKTPTQNNGGNDAGVPYTNAVDVEIEALWKCVATELVNIGGTANAIVASSDTALVAALSAYARPMAFWLTPTAANTTAVIIAIDGLSPAVAINDRSGNALASGALTAGARHLIVFDGTAFRLFTSAGASSAGSYNGTNGGRLTLISGSPRMTAVTTGATAIYWTPDNHNQLGLYDGVSAWAIVAAAECSVNTTASQTGNTHNGSKIIDGLTDTSQLVVGMKISGTGIGAGALISTVDSATQVTASVNSTADGSASITFKCPADTGYDVFGKNVTSALKLFLVKRSSILTANVTVKQDGIDVLSTDKTMRWLGAVITSATDGQVDFVQNGQRRFRLWNRNNRMVFRNTERFTASGVWYKPIGLVSLEALLIGSGVSSAVDAGACSFNSLSINGSYPGPFIGSGGDINSVSTSVLNPYAAAGVGSTVAGGMVMKTFGGATLGASEAVTIGNGGNANGLFTASELVEY